MIIRPGELMQLWPPCLGQGVREPPMVGYRLEQVAVAVSPQHPP